ncbi:hypothetical protein SLS57_008308 [Botryosphaeria dothidea]
MAALIAAQLRIYLGATRPDSLLVSRHPLSINPISRQSSSLHKQISSTTPKIPMSAKSFDNAAFEAEKAAITSYEENWDSWDGPVWDWRSTNKPEAPANKSLEALKRPALVRASTSCSSIQTISSESSEWHASATPACTQCGHGKATIHV